jgi:hypothetical protein
MKRSTKIRDSVVPPVIFFAELSEGMEALADSRRGKLRTHAMEFVSGACRK